MEVAGFVGDPAYEVGQRGVFLQDLGIRTTSGKLGVRESRMQRAMADGVNRNGLASAAALGHRMMPFDPVADNAFAQPAMQRIGIVHRHAK